MLLIPVSYAPVREADIPAETLGCFAQPVCDIPPITAGSLALCEIAEARWVIDPSRNEPVEAARALWIIAHRELAVPAVAAYEAGDRERIDRLAAEWLTKRPELPAALPTIVRRLIAPVSTGFAMLPRGGDNDSSEWWFGSEFLGTMVAAGCSLGLGNWREVTWDVPLTLLGHVVAADTKRRGRKGVCRKEDAEKMDELVEKWVAMEAAGELLPWQVAEPQKYPPTEVQIAARPEVMADYERLLAECEK